jgi:hypothetical protein
MDLELSAKYSGSLNDTELVDCFLNLPDLNADPFPLDFAHIAQGQQLDQELLQQRTVHPIQYPNQRFQGVELILF